MSRSIRTRRTNRPATQALLDATAPIEALEARRLLAATFNPTLGILTISAEPGNNIVQAERLSPEQFVIHQSTTTAAQPPTVPTFEQVINYIATGEDNQVTHGPFAFAEVNLIRINMASGDDMVILGRRLEIPTIVRGGFGNDTLSGGPADDQIFSSGGNSYLWGGDGHDLLVPGTEASHVLGGPGFDIVSYDNRPGPINLTLGQVSPGIGTVYTDVQAIIGTNFNDFIDASNAPGPVQIDGLAGNDTLIGSQFDDTLIAGGGNDSLVGGGGNNLFLAEDAGTDTIVGGAGQDTAFVDIDNTAFGTGPITDTWSNVQVILPFDPAAPDPTPTELGEGQEPAATFEDGVLIVSGTEWNDQIRLIPGAEDTTFVIRSTSNAPEPVPTQILHFDNIFTTVLINAVGGNNLISAGNTGVATTINGGDGNDTILGSDADDDIRTGGGDNWAFGRAGDDRLVSGHGANFLSGGAGNDTLDYSDRSENLIVGLGVLPDDGAIGERDNAQLDINVLIGGSGNDDLLTTGTVPVTIMGGPGNDTIRGGQGDDLLVAGPGNNVLHGTAGNNFFEAANGFADTIFGGTGQDDGNFDEDLDVVQLNN